MKELASNWSPLTGSVIGMAVGLGSLPLYSNSAVYVELERNNGWSASSTALIFLIANLAMAGVGPFWGRLLDRFGTRGPAMVSGVVLGLSYLIMAAFPGNFALYVFTQILAYTGAVGTVNIAYSRVITMTFNRSRGLAFGIMNTGPAIAAFVLPGLSSGAFNALGMRGGFALLGAIAIVGTFIAVAFIPKVGRSKREARAELAIAAPLKPSATLFLLIAVFFVGSTATMGLIQELFAMLLKAGTPMGTTVMVMSSIGIAMLVVRLVIGFLLDIFDPKWVAFTTFAIAAIGVSLLGFAGPSVAMVSALVVGLALGSETDVMPMMVSLFFPKEQFGRVMGLIGMSFGLGAALGPFLLASIMDRTVSIAPTALTAAGLLAAACIIFLFLPKARRPRTDIDQDATEAA